MAPLGQWPAITAGLRSPCPHDGEVSFTDLPTDWEREPLSDARRAADVLDLFVPDDMRQRGAIYLLLCDSEDRLVQPCAVETLPKQSADLPREPFFAPFVEVLTGLTSGGAILVALARPDGLSVTDSDREWQNAGYAVCSAAGVRLLGVHLLTRHGSRVLPLLRPRTG